MKIQNIFPVQHVLNSFHESDWNTISPFTNFLFLAEVEQDVRNEDEIDIDEAFDDGEDFVVDTKPLKRQAEDKEVEASSKSKPRIE